MSQTAKWLGACMAAALLMGVVIGWYVRERETRIREENFRKEADAVRQRLAEVGARYGRQTAQLKALQQEGERLQNRVRELAVALGAAKDEAETLRRSRPKEGSADALPPPAGVMLNAPVIRVADVNPQLKMLVADVGSRDGMQAGMSFYVVHDKTPVADVRAADVRETFTGMVIEKIYAGKQPAPGDRLIVRKK
jgi:hypothetical protein